MTVAVFLFSLLGAMAVGVPIAFALIVCGVALMVQLDNFDAQIVAQNLVNGADSFSLLAVPFFILAGEFMNAGGLSRRIVDLAMAIVGHKRGGLGYVAVFTTVLMASMSGSAVADTAAVGAMLIPMMRKADYDINRSAGLIASGGIIAPVLPPSIPFIIFGAAGGVSISKLFMAGIVPGILMGVALLVTWWLVTRKEALAVSERQSAGDVLRCLLRGFWALLIPVIIIGGIKMGVFTPTEAGVVAAVYAFFVGIFVYKELKVSQLYGLLLSAGKTTAIIMLLVAAASVSAWMLTIADLPQQLIQMLEPLLDDKILLMVVIMVLVVIIGTAMDLVPTILILTPVLMPLIKQAGIDPVYFGVLFIMNCSIGLITPPVGNVLNVICGVSKISMNAAVRGVWPFLLAHLLLLAAFTLFPSLVLVPMKWW